LSTIISKLVLTLRFFDIEKNFFVVATFATSPGMFFDLSGSLACKQDASNF